MYTINYAGYYQQAQHCSGTEYWLISQDIDVNLDTLPAFTYWWEHGEVVLAMEDDECIFNFLDERDD